MSSTALASPRRHRSSTALIVGVVVVAVVVVALGSRWVGSLAGRAVSGGPTAYDEDVVGIANLDPDLLAALRAASASAAEVGVGITVTSGWRSEAEQDRLLQDAIVTYGSLEEASRWVAPPSASAHVSGDAVDVGPVAAQEWLAVHGAAYGLCRIYRNEPWHYELRSGAELDGCPAMYDDATDDPRMRP